MGSLAIHLLRFVIFEVLLLLILRLGKRHGNRILRVILGGLVVLGVMRLMLLAVSQTGAVFVYSVGSLSISLKMLGVIFFSLLGLMIVLLREGIPAATVLTTNLGILIVVSGGALPWVFAQEPVLSTLRSAVLPMTAPALRHLLAFFLAWVVGAISMMFSLQVFSVRWGAKNPNLAAPAALGLGVLLETLIFGLLATIGTASWTQVLAQEFLGSLLMLAALLPLAAWYFARLRSADPFSDPRLIRRANWRQIVDLRWALAQTEQRAERLDHAFALLNECRQRIMAASSKPTLLSSVAKRLEQEPHYQHASIALLEDQQLRRYEKTKPGSSPSAPGSELSSLTEAEASALESGKPVMMIAGSRGSDPDPFEPKMHSRAVIPLMFGDKPFGVLALSTVGADDIQRDDLFVLQAIAADLAQGLRRITLVKQRSKRMAESEAIRDLTASMIAEHDVDKLLHGLVERASFVLEAEAGLLYLVDLSAEGGRCVVHFGGISASACESFAMADGFLRQVLRDGQAIIIDDRHGWPKEVLLPGSMGPGEVLCAPLVRQGQVAGVICILRSRGSEPFSQDDLELLQLFANHATVALENAHLIEDVRRRALQLQWLNELTTATSAATDMPTLIETMRTKLCLLLEASSCAIALWDDEKQKFLPVGDSELAEEFDEDNPAWVKRHLATLKAVEGGVPVIVDDPVLLPMMTTAANAIVPARIGLLIPLRADQRRQGVAVLLFEERRSFSSQDLGLCMQAANQMALATAKTRALDAERKRSTEMNALRQASLSVTSSLELRQVLEAILGHTLKLVKADDVHIFQYIEGKIKFGAVMWGDGKTKEPFAEPRSDGLTYTVARTGERIVIPEVSSSKLFSGWDWGGAIAGFPLKISNEVVGVMNVAFNSPHDFDADELRALSLLANQAAIAIRNADIYGRMVDERRRLQLLYDVTREVSRLLEPQEILLRIIELTAQHLDGVGGHGFLLQSGTDRLRLAAMVRDESGPLDEIDARLDMRIGKGLEGWVAEHKQPVLLADVSTDPRWIDIPDTPPNIQSAVSAPILSAERLLGVIIITGDKSFSEEQLDLLVTISRQAGLALSHAERYQQIRRRLAELTVLQQVADVVNRRLEMQPLMEEVTIQVGEVLGYPVVQIYLLDGDRLLLGAAWGDDDLWAPELSINQGIIGRVARTRSPANIPDTRLDPDYYEGTEGMLSEMTVPVMQGENVVGVLNVESPELNAFGTHDLRLLTLLSDQVAIAIENASLYERVRDHAELLGRTVEERTAELAAALKEAQAADRMKTQFVSDVSHELRTPLSNIRLYLELLRQGKTDRFEAYLETLNRETDRLVNLIEDLLAISRLDAGTVIPQPREIDINALARSLVEDRQRMISERQLTVMFEAAEGLPPVQVDGNMISQVVANLMTNAMNYTPAGGQVLIKSALRQAEDGDWITLTVADSGLGIPDDEIDHIFERFFRGQSGRSLGLPGTGLGLAICKEILDRHGGSITVNTKPGEGSAFTIELPAPGLASRHLAAPDGAGSVQESPSAW